MLSGFKLPKQKPTSSAKKRKEDAAAVPPSAEKGGNSARISPARSSSRGQEEHRRVESVLMAPLAPEVPAPGAVDEVPAAPQPAISQALMTISPPPTAAPPLLGSSAPAAAAAASEKEKQSAANATADREVVLKDAKAARDRCQVLEDELQSMRDKHTEEARCRQAKEEEMKAREDAVKNHDAELADHLHLRDPNACLDDLLEPVAEYQCEAAAAASPSPRIP
nr:testis-specific gene A8 protein-like [Aegilops tauschii subsp. strangulata]